MEKKTRINITVDEQNLEKAKTKLKLFGGKISTLFDAYLADFVSTMSEEASQSKKEMNEKINEIEERISKIEKKLKNKQNLL